MLACDVPIVAQIDGACMGAGMEIASTCDIRIAGESARFGAPIAKPGLSHGAARGAAGGARRGRADRARDAAGSRRAGRRRC
jgi:enoyl-CoA hydratase/carnithine racemase